MQFKELNLSHRQRVVELCKPISGGHEPEHLWEMAWRARNTSLRSFSEAWRPLILLAREVANPTRTPKGGSPMRHWADDIDSNGYYSNARKAAID